MLPRENPFASHRIDALPYGLRGGSWRELIGQFEGLGRRAAVVGPRGSGKTAFLHSFGERIRDRLGVNAVYVRADRQDPPRNPSEMLLLLDGTERMGCLARRRTLAACSRAWGILFALHRPTGATPLYRTATSPDLLYDLAAQLATGRSGKISRETLDRLFLRHGGNLREVFCDLYDRYADSAPSTPNRPA